MRHVFRLWLLCLIIGIFPIFNFGQHCWTFSETQWDFVVNYAQKEITIEVSSVEIWSKTSGNILQVILPPEEETHIGIYPDDSAYFFICEDMNFDGFKDIRLMNWVSINYQFTYWYWFWNPETSLFERNTCWEEILNPYFDQQKQQLHSHWRIGCCEMGHAYYAWRACEPQLLVSEIWSFPPWETDTFYHGWQRLGPDGYLQDSYETVLFYDFDYLHDRCDLK